MRMIYLHAAIINSRLNAAPCSNLMWFLNLSVPSSNSKMDPLHRTQQRVVPSAAILELLDIFSHQGHTSEPFILVKLHTLVHTFLVSKLVCYAAAFLPGLLGWG